MDESSTSIEATISQAAIKILATSHLSGSQQNGFSQW